MKLELKNVKFYEGMSEETNAFTADVYVDGKKLLEAKNDGRGGSTDVRIHGGLYKNGSFPDGTRAKIAEVEAYCLTLPPPEDYLSLKMNLEHKVGDLFEEWLKAKDSKAQVKKMKTNEAKGIIFGTPEEYQILSWKGHTLAQILANQKYREVAKKKVQDLVAEGKNILNTNLPEDFMN